jgi:hypothetical protein
MAGNAAWVAANMDVNARSSIHDDIFMGGRANRFTLLSQLGLQWSGCVEARPMSNDSGLLDLDVTDTPPNQAVPDTLFVPYLRARRAGQLDRTRLFEQLPSGRNQHIRLDAAHGGYVSLHHPALDLQRQHALRRSARAGL